MAEQGHYGNGNGETDGQYYRRCLICHGREEEGPLIKPCNCQQGLYHYNCLIKWIEWSHDSPCAACQQPYRDKRIERIEYTPNLTQFLMTATLLQHPRLFIVGPIYLAVIIRTLIALLFSSWICMRVIYLIMVGYLAKGFLAIVRESHRKHLERHRAYYPRHLTKFVEHPATHNGKQIDYTADVRTRRAIEIRRQQELRRERQLVHELEIN